MNDEKRESIIRGSAFGYLLVIALFFIFSMFAGKDFGVLLLFILILPYSLYYWITYWVLCKGYEDEIKRILSFGIMSRSSFVGIMYNLSIMLSLILSFLVVAGLYEYFKIA